MSAADSARLLNALGFGAINYYAWRMRNKRPTPGHGVICITHDSVPHSVELLIGRRYFTTRGSVR